jgi:catechol 2,3-dioxygenase-like lactoylglutathione lyase family enzyme
MRLVKKRESDSPGTYHLFYADGDGIRARHHVFPVAGDAARQTGRRSGDGSLLAIPLGTTDYWIDRLTEHHLAVGEVETRRGPPSPSRSTRTALTLHETGDRESAVARRSVPAEKQIRGLHSVRLWSDVAHVSVYRVFGFVDIGTEGSGSASRLAAVARESI